MSPVRLLLDEMISPSVAAQLCDRGHDVTAVAAAPELRGSSDEHILEVAGTVEERVVVTLNVADFAALDARWRGWGRVHAGIVFVTTAAFPQDRRFIGSLVAALQQILVTLAKLPGSAEITFLRPAAVTD